MKQCVWFDGAIVDVDDVRVSPFDHGLLTGDGVFETLKVYEGRAFALRRHLERLAASAGGMGLPMPAPDLLRTAIDEVVAVNEVDTGRVRITLTGGVAPLGSERGKDGVTILVASASLAPWPSTADVVVVPWPRNERGALAGVKTTSYGENVVALAYAHERGASEAIFANTVGSLCEGTGTNVFAVIDGELLTPPLTSGCLAGVTRALIIELTAAKEIDVPVGALADATEVFLTSTTREVQPVAHVDGHAVPIVPGARATTAAAAFADLVARDIDP